jgi:hypothetical protein
VGGGGGFGAGAAFVTDCRVQGKAFVAKELGAENDRFTSVIGG